MSQSIIFTRRYQFSNDVISQSETITGDVLVSVSQTCPAGVITTIDAAITGTETVAVYMSTDTDCTVTFPAGSHTETFALKANSPEIWSEHTPGAAVIPYNFSSIQINVPAGDDAAIEFRFLSNS